MGRFILIFRGKGHKPVEDVERIRTLQNTTVLDDSSPRMILVEAPETELKKIVNTMPGWIISKEKMIPLPDQRPKIDDNQK